MKKKMIDTEEQASRDRALRAWQRAEYRAWLWRDWIERGDITAEIEHQIRKGRKFADLFEKVKETGHYVFRPWRDDPAAAETTWQKFGRLRAQYEAHPLKDSDRKTAHLRWLASQADEAA